jgi:hypothetical protein
MPKEAKCCDPQHDDERETKRLAEARHFEDGLKINIRSLAWSALASSRTVLRKRILSESVNKLKTD